MLRPFLPGVLGLTLAFGCASIERHLSRDEYGQACLSMAEQYEDDEYVSVKQAIGSQLDVRWTMQAVPPNEATEEYRMPVVNGPHGVLARVRVEVRALPAGARGLTVHTPTLASKGELQPDPGWLDHPLRDAFFPAPAELVMVDVPPPYERKAFDPGEPAPRLKYVKGSSREPAPNRALRDAVRLMTLGLVKQPRSGPRLTDASRRELQRWQKRHDAEFQAWRTREDEAARQSHIARETAMQRNEWVTGHLYQWEQDRNRVWKQLLTWPCAMNQLEVGGHCEGVVLMPAAAAPLKLRFMSTMAFAVEEDGCDLTVSGDSPEVDTLEAVLAPFDGSASQTDVAPLDYVGSYPWI
ncbi:MAG: hypothetical protein AAF799_16315 [Myxococcota bacterium]